MSEVGDALRWWPGVECQPSIDDIISKSIRGTLGYNRNRLRSLPPKETAGGSARSPPSAKSVTLFDTLRETRFPGPHYRSARRPNGRTPDHTHESIETGREACNWATTCPALALSVMKSWEANSTGNIQPVPCKARTEKAEVAWREL
jgi:hypothetical protein